jgi:hypothetical protein
MIAVTGLCALLVTAITHSYRTGFPICTAAHYGNRKGMPGTSELHPESGEMSKMPVLIFGFWPDNRLIRLKMPAVREKRLFRQMTVFPFYRSINSKTYDMLGFRLCQYNGTPFLRD